MTVPVEAQEALRERGTMDQDGAALIAAERRRQVEVEGWTAEHDRHHVNWELDRAAAIYAVPDGYRGRIYSAALWPVGWTFKPTPDDRLRELVKAGALIAAAIDLLIAEDSADDSA